MDPLCAEQSGRNPGWSGVIVALLRFRRRLKRLSYNRMFESSYMG